ncbi:MAG: hypothetical protein U5K43_14345 [Halofilum sp. (in: g-proteobacteria)]|nr:hypothetical protein [Halofilum sp. (in: g-proteobacteria)]
MADFWVRCEHPRRTSTALSQRLDLPWALGATVRDVWAKSEWRERPPWRDYYDDDTRRVVALQFASEIELMGYTFQGG